MGCSSIVDCGSTPDILNGAYTLLNTTNTTFASLANVTCAAGYESNVSQIMCQENAMWTTSYCVPKGYILLILSIRFCYNINNNGLCRLGVITKTTFPFHLVLFKSLAYYCKPLSYIHNLNCCKPVSYDINRKLARLYAKKFYMGACQLRWNMLMSFSEICRYFLQLNCRQLSNHGMLINCMIYE